MNAKSVILAVLSLSVPCFAQGQSARAPALPSPGGASDLEVFGPWVRLQGGYPGIAQNGNAHLNGRFKADASAGIAIHGISTDPFGIGVYGEDYTFQGMGVVGRSTYVAVWGDNVGFAPGCYGVHGAGWVGVLGQDNTGGGYGVVSDGSCFVDGDLIVTGAKTGYVVDLVKNAGDVPLEPGDLVEIDSSGEAVLGDIPLVLVRKASSANARAVLGPISNALEIGPALATPPTSAQSSGTLLEPLRSAQAERAPSVQRITGAIRPGGYGNVVTLGAFRAVKVDARFGPIQAGDLLVASPEPGFAMADPDPRVGTVIGKALAPWSQGQGEIPLMVTSR